jgi:hypothetical protein
MPLDPAIANEVSTCLVKATEELRAAQVDLKAESPLPDAFHRDKPRWRESQRKLPIDDKVALLGQIILETLELEKIKKHAKSL